MADLCEQVGEAAACAPAAESGQGYPKSRKEATDRGGQVWQLERLQHVGHQEEK